MGMNSLYKLQNQQISNTIFSELLYEVAEIRDEWLVLIYEQLVFARRILKTPIGGTDYKSAPARRLKIFGILNKRNDERKDQEADQESGINLRLGMFPKYETRCCN